MAETKTPYEVACEAIKWDKNGNPDHLPVPLASDMTSPAFRVPGSADGCHCALGIGRAIVGPSLAGALGKGHEQLAFYRRFKDAYCAANRTSCVCGHSDGALDTDTERAQAVQSAFAEMGYSA